MKKKRKPQLAGANMKVKEKTRLSREVLRPFVEQLIEEENKKDMPEK